MSDTPSADLLGALDFVVMQRVAQGSFYVHGTPPAWLRRVNARWKGERQILASRTFPFLDHFLADAEEFWATGEVGRVGSGLSIEPGTDGADVHFEAWAVTVQPGEHYLVLELKRAGAELQAMLQRAREGLLDHERLVRAQEALTRSQHELRREKARAEAAAEAHAAVLRTITHEVRTPVHAIIGLTGLVLDAPLPPAHARFLSLIRSSSETLLAVLNDMLDASRLEAGALPLDERPFDVRDTIEEALGTVAIRAAERGLDLVSQVELSVPETVIGDRARWRLVLVSLLANAVGWSARGDVRVLAEAADRGEGRAEIHVAVQDQGPGLSEAELERLFAGGGRDGRRGAHTAPGHGRHREPHAGRAARRSPVGGQHHNGHYLPLHRHVHGGRHAVVAVSACPSAGAGGTACLDRGDERRGGAAAHQGDTVLGHDAQGRTSTSGPRRLARGRGSAGHRDRRPHGTARVRRAAVPAVPG
ncbi:MAG TPA: HAMP domain-containing sensor histidine kinase, partial [Longimicrobiales bacterium]|nr:HAMP domain-containing sensor histidine kinase [Longimicrobiales bacterium]